MAQKIGCNSICLIQKINLTAKYWRRQGIEVLLLNFAQKLNKLQMIDRITNAQITSESPAFAKPVLAEVPLVVSFSGGRTSAFMARALQLRYENKRDLIFIFANTGKERIETLDFINECETRWNLNCVWLEYDLVEDKSTFKIVDYNSASRNGEPFEKMITKYGIPNKAFPHCTRELKRQTITRYLRTIGLNNGKYETAIGI